ETTDTLTSIITTVTADAEGIEHLSARLMPIHEKLPTKYELVFINDGSNYNTLELLLEKQTDIPEIAIVELSRNYGKEAALFYGFS
ncbi:glycosyltransferase, partial [Francisella tularensis subsp. holarctica]|uniref:glycosyltransferase n=1 Tax=Francisella tularensis TaxID=263 RepID=UPI002381B4CD